MAAARKGQKAGGAVARTLLHKHGFRDIDAGNTDHELACQFLAQVDQCDALMVLALGQPDEGAENISGPMFDKISNARVAESEWGIVAVEHEAPISKGEGQYKQTIGFADVVITAAARWLVKFTRTRGGVVTQEEERGGGSWNRSVLVEVKATRISGSEILKQLNLYREHVRFDAVIAATLFDLTREDAELLRSQGVKCVRLGKKFEAWKATTGGRAIDVEEL